MRIDSTAHHDQPWRIHEIAPDFTVEDVWDLPVHGDADEFPAVIDLNNSFDFPGSAPLPVRLLWGFRDLLGRWFGLGRISTSVGDADASRGLPIPGAEETTLADRLPPDLRATAVGNSRGNPLLPLYSTDVEHAEELSNRTVHSVMHLGWVDKGDGGFRARMAVLVKPRGRFGRAYMAFIKPFRLWIVYPALMRSVEREWKRRQMGEPDVTATSAPS